MKNIVTDTYNFERLITEGYIYVDKTAYILKLLSKTFGSLFFYARPRRFGKSLLVSTLKCLFEGRRELFKGLAIDQSDYAWETYPVLHLDMGSTQATTVEEFRLLLCIMMRKQATLFGCTLPDYNIPSQLFADLCEAIAAKSPKGQFVLLVDEYDKPLLGALNTPQVEVYRDELKAFYSVIKTKEALQRFTFITGISKFSKVSIFSDLNNLTDISMSAPFATMLGYTHEELKHYFHEHIAALADAQGMTYEAAYAEILRWYDGYKFEENADLIINPVSLGLCLKEKKLKTYWSSTAVPTFLVDLLKESPRHLSKVEMDETQLDAYEPTHLNIITLLFQTGYLTIKDFMQSGSWRSYILDFPNMEVRNAFNSSLAQGYSTLPDIDVCSCQTKCIRAILRNDLETFFETMKIFFANLPYEFSKHAPEETYQAVFCAILYFVGVAVQTEVSTNVGRIDAVMETNTHVYIMEFKRDSTAEAALQQIQEKKYYERFLGSGKTIVLLGANFNSDLRNLDHYVLATLGE